MPLVLTKSGVKPSIREKPAVPEKPAAGRVRVIKPHDGPQEVFLSSPSDIAVYGGAAGGGKSYGLLMEAARNLGTPGYGAVIFRRTFSDITKEGGLWDESMELYPLLGGKPIAGKHEWRFPPHGCTITFHHMQHEVDKIDWQGSQLPFIGWDELTHFSASMFFYLMSRLRSSCGVIPYVRATCNPDPDSWVASFISWWIDPRTGYPIAERSGKLRWFIRQGDEILWADTRAELLPSCKPDQLPLSVTFVAASVDDNPTLLANNPGYKSSLHALPKVERERLLGGNWKIRRNAGDFFRRSWFGDPIEPKDLPRMVKMVRYWDRASTEQKGGNDPDWTVGLLMGKSDNGMFYVIDVERFRGTPGTVEQRIREVGIREPDVAQVLEQDPGQAGASEVFHLARALQGIPVLSRRVGASKAKRALPVSAACEKRLVKVVRAPWNDAYFDELEAFCDPEDLPDDVTPPHDDQVDTTSGAHGELCRGNPRLRVL